MDPIERYKGLKKLDKILDFLEQEQHNIHNLSKNEFYREIIVQTILDFHLKEKNKDYRHYPWFIKILLKRKEMYGW